MRDLATGAAVLQAVKNLRVKGHRIMEKNWTAFLRLKGKTRTKSADDILEQFVGLVQSLRGVDMDYNIIVFLEGEDPRALGPLNGVGRPETRVPSEGGGA